MRNIPFDQYQRYKNTEQLINSIRKDGEQFKILEVGANAHKNLEKFLPNDNVTYLDIMLPEELKNDPQCILGDATDMTFDAGSFDIVIALDVYEHIPKDRRENFINELYRVSSKIAIIAAPFNKPEVVAAEIRANEYFKVLSGIDHIWLIEHIDYQLPCLEELKSFLNSSNIQYNHFSHGSLKMWEKLTNMHLATVVFGGLINYKNEIDNYYNEFVFDNDYDENGYRDFFVLNKGQDVVTAFNYENKCENKIEVLEQNFYNLLNLGSINLRNQQNTMGKNVDNIKVYVDYGNGFSEDNTLDKKFTLNKEQQIIVKEFENSQVSVLRIDPTEAVGKFTFNNLIIKNELGEVVKDFKITSNCDVNTGDKFIFGHNDPQIIIEIKNTIISSLEFTIKKIVDYDNDNKVIEEVINTLKEEINKKNIIINNQNGIISKFNKIRCKMFNK